MSGAPQANGQFGLPNTSDTWNFRPAIADFILEAYERIGIFGPMLEDTRYIISARRSTNLILNDFSGNRGVNLWKVGDEDNTLTIPLVPGQASYKLPTNVVYILDTYLRQYTPSSTYASIGNALVPMTDGNGRPMTDGVGRPMLASPDSGVFSTTQGSALATMRWPNHGLLQGSPVFFEMPTSLGLMTLGGPLNGFSAVDSVIDQNTLSIVLPGPAPSTNLGTGGTPLFWTVAGSDIVNVILPGYGLGFDQGSEQPMAVGAQFIVQVPTTVGGLTLSGAYTVVGVSMPPAGVQPYEFQFQASGAALSGAAAFENGGQILVASQAAGAQFTDTLLWPLSRTDWAALPNKYTQGRPSVFWFNRAVQPTLHVWATAQANSTWAVCAYRMLEIEDADPLMGQQLDLPRRFFPALTAELTAALAEKWKPEMHLGKLALARDAWERAANADREMVSSYIVPQMQSYFRGY